MNINSLIKYSPNLAFCANDRTVKGTENQVVHRNTTQLFRDDIVWKDFAKLMEENFSDSDKVNIHCMACSDGSEPYSLAASLMSNVNEPEKFFPIHASDYDEEIIDTAQKSEYAITNIERSAMRKHTNGRWDNYFENDGPNCIKPKENLKSAVNFKVSNALDEADSIDYGTNVIMCRNFFPYLSAEDKNTLINIIREKMDDKSLLVIGSYDQKGVMLDRLLSVSGFEPIEYTYDDNGSEMIHYNVWRKSV